MASRDPKDLSPAMQDLCAAHLAACAADPRLIERGVHVFITCTYRPGTEQDALYAQGRTKPGHIITNARAGQSAHNVAVDGEPNAEAYDVAILENGKLVWNDGDDWEIVGELGEKTGLKWYGAPGAKFPEKPHFQNPDWSL